MKFKISVTNIHDLAVDGNYIYQINNLWDGATVAAGNDRLDVIIGNGYQDIWDGVTNTYSLAGNSQIPIVVDRVYTGVVSVVSTNLRSVIEFDRKRNLNQDAIGIRTLIEKRENLNFGQWTNSGSYLLDRQFSIVIKMQMMLALFVRDILRLDMIQVHITLGRFQIPLIQENR